MNDNEVGDRYRFGWYFDADSDNVWNNQHEGGGPSILDENGEFDQYIARYKEQRAKGKGGLWGRVGPVIIDGIEIRQNTRIWHTEMEEWLQAHEIDVSEDPEPIILFKIRGRWPAHYIEYFGSDLERLREDGTVESHKEVNDRAEKILEEFRSKEAGSS